MTTITITVNEKTAKGKKFVEFIKTLDYVKLHGIKPSPELKQAIKEAKDGNVIRGKNVNDLLHKLKE